MKRYIKAKISDLSTEDYDSLEEIAGNPETSSEVLEQIAELRHMDRHKYAMPYEALVQNPNTPESLLKSLYHSNHWLAEYIAKNPNISTEFISEMLEWIISNDIVDDELFIQLGYNPRITAKQLKQMTDYAITKSNTENVMWYLLKNDKLPASALHHLVHSHKFNWMSSSLIYEVYEHPNVTPAIKSFLENKYGEYFR